MTKQNSQLFRILLCICEFCKITISFFWDSLSDDLLLIIDNLSLIRHIFDAWISSEMRWCYSILKWRIGNLFFLVNPIIICFLQRFRILKQELFKLVPWQERSLQLKELSEEHSYCILMVHLEYRIVIEEERSELSWYEAGLNFICCFVFSSEDKLTIWFNYFFWSGEE